MIAWWASVALAAPEAYPWCAPVDLPGGTLRISVPLDLRSVDDPEDGSDLILLDPDGSPVSFARIEGDPGEIDRVALRVEPTGERWVWAVDVGARPVDVLQIRPPSGTLAVTATVRQGGAVIGGPKLVWQLSSSVETDVPVAGASGRLEITLDPLGDEQAYGGPEVQGVRRRGPTPAPARIEVPLGPPVLQENGFARYDFALPRPLPANRFRVEATPAVFERTASVEAAPTGDGPGYLGQELYPSTSATIQRVAVGAVRVESAVVPGPSAGSERYALLVQAAGLDPLPVTGVVAEVDQAELLVLSARPGSYTLCGGAPTGTTGGSDLSIATPELIRTASGTVAPGAVAPNPSYRPPEVRANLVGPGPDLDRDRFRWKRSVDGVGLVEVVLPGDVLSTARPDLADLRLLTPGGQIPYVLRRLPADPELEGVVETRSEDAGRSWIVLHLPERGLPLVRLVLRTDAPTFSRRVTVYRPDQGTRETLRSVEWTSQVRPHALSIELVGPVDDTLLVAVDNGDDPPLPLSAPIEVQSAGWELVTVLPEGGATLMYGAPALSGPDYDLSLLSAELRRRATAQATLGPVEPGGRGRLTTPDRLLLAAGLAVLALGLVGLAAEVLRRLPSEGVPPRDPA